MRKKYALIEQRKVAGKQSSICSFRDAPYIQILTNSDLQLTQTSWPLEATKAKQSLVLSPGNTSIYTLLPGPSEETNLFTCLLETEKTDRKRQHNLLFPHPWQHSLLFPHPSIFSKISPPLNFP